MSSPPSSFTVRPMSRSTASSSVISVGTAKKRLPRLPTSPATRLISSALRAATVTSAPASARASAMARPKPLPPPVTTATRPVRARTSASPAARPAPQPALAERPSSDLPEPGGPLLAEGGNSFLSIARSGGERGLVGQARIQVVGVAHGLEDETCGARALLRNIVGQGPDHLEQIVVEDRGLREDTKLVGARRPPARRS